MQNISFVFSIIENHADVSKSKKTGYVNLLPLDASQANI